MKKKLLIALTAITAAFCGVFSFSACNDGEEQPADNGEHRHDLTPVFENAVYGTADGDIAYYECGGCGKRFSDGAGAKEFNYGSLKRFEKEFAIKGLDDGAVPQGMTSYYAGYSAVDTEDNPITKMQQYFLTSAYMSDGSASRIYVTGEDSGYIGFVTLQNEDGTPHKGSVSGIAVNGKHLWIGYNDSILVATASEEYENENVLREIINKAKINESGEADETLSIKFTASFKANCNVSFIGYFDDARYVETSYDRLYVGGLCRKGNDNAVPYMYEYNVDRLNSKNNPYGLARIESSGPDISISDNVPKIQKIFSIPEKIQGVAFFGRLGSSTTLTDSDSMIVLSQSCGLSGSHLLCFDWKVTNATANKQLYTEVSGGKSFEYDGIYTTYGCIRAPYTYDELYVYKLDTADKTLLVNDYQLPPAAKGICGTAVKSGTLEVSKRIFVLFESGIKNYEPFNIEQLKNVYSFIPANK